MAILMQPAKLTEQDRREIARETARLNPPEWRVCAWDGQGRSGHVRLLGIDAGGGEYLIWRKSVRTAEESEAWYWAINRFLASRSDWNGLRDVPGANEEEALTF